MRSLDDIKKIAKLDQQNMRASIEALYLQCEQAWNDVKQVKIPEDYKNVNKVLINGMGGSALGGHIIRKLFADQLKVPVEVINDYYFPNYLDENTLYIISSYSGTTEEPISTVEEAIKIGAKVLGVGTGAKLGELMGQYHLPWYQIKPDHNPCGQPRMGVGYSVVGQVGLMSQCGLIKIDDHQISTVVSCLKEFNGYFEPAVETDKNIAKQIASKIKGKIPVIVASNFLEGNAHVMANQINENSKNFSNYFSLPEINHHLLEGLEHPGNISEFLCFVFIQSELYHPRTQKRFAITQDIVAKHSVDHIFYKATAKTKLSQSFEALLLGSYVGFYLAMLNKLDPSPVPWVDYFKEELAR